jgi:hypothetical protein
VAPLSLSSARHCSQITTTVIITPIPAIFPSQRRHHIQPVLDFSLLPCSSHHRRSSLHIHLLWLSFSVSLQRAGALQSP